jgi:HEAT repeat protein
MTTPADRVAAVKALKEMGNQAEIAVLKLLESDDMWIRVSAIDVLSKVGGQSATEALAAAVESDTEEFVRSRAQSALRELQSRPAVDAG